MFITDYQFELTKHFVERFRQRLMPLHFDDIQKYAEKALSKPHRRVNVFIDRKKRTYHYVNGYVYIEANNVLITIIKEGGESLYA